MKALTFSKFGNSDVLEYQEIPAPQINELEVLIQMKAIGLNYADIYRRKGNYHLKGNPPYIAGYEGAGIVVETKSTKYKIGDRVAFADVPFANAELVAAHEDKIIPLQANVSLELAATVLLQGLTAHYLAIDSHCVREGEWVLVHAAAGGVGQILTQICKMKGAKVIGLSRGESKLKTITESKADLAIDLNSDWKQQVKEITLGKGVDVAYDSIGSSLMDSIAATRECGHIVFYGMSGGNPPLIDPRHLMDSSKTLTGGDLWSYLSSADERVRRSNELFEWILSGRINIKAPSIFKLSEGQKAHDFLEQGFSSGKVLMVLT